jgi:hypothetical protein
MDMTLLTDRPVHPASFRRYLELRLAKECPPMDGQDSVIDEHPKQKARAMREHFFLASAAS